MCGGYSPTTSDIKNTTFTGPAKAAKEEVEEEEEEEEWKKEKEEGQWNDGKFQIIPPE